MTVVFGPKARQSDREKRDKVTVDNFLNEQGYSHLPHDWSKRIDKSRLPTGERLCLSVIPRTERSNFASG